MNDDTQSPYGSIGEYSRLPELERGDDYAQDYAVAFEIGHTVTINTLEDTGTAIREAVNEALGPNVPILRVLAVATMAAEARIRGLRREDIATQEKLKALERPRRKSWFPPNILKKKTERSLLSVQYAARYGHGACLEAICQYIEEARDISAFTNDLLTD